MPYFEISLGYFLANLAIATLVIVKSRQNILHQFYGFCVVSLCCLGLSGYMIENKVGGVPLRLVVQISAFLYALFPFFFLHFMIIFVRRYEILKSKSIIVANYFTGLFGYSLLLAGLVPFPFSIESGIGPVGHIYYLTWMSILFSIGVALLYSSIGGFNERGINSNLLFIVFAVLMLLLPSPFTLSLFSFADDNSYMLHFISAISALAAVVFIVFRHRITMNTPYQAMKTALGAMNDILFKTNQDFTIEMAQGATQPILGFSQQELIGRNLSDFLRPKEYLEEYLGFVFKNKLREAFFDAELICRDGALVWMDFSFTPVLSNEEVVGFVGVGRNISKRRSAELALKESELRYRSLFESNPSPVCSSAPDGSIIDCNPAFARVFGFGSVADAIGSNLSQLFPSPRAFEEFIKVLVERNRLDAIEMELRRVDGAVVYAVGNLVCILGKDGELAEVESYLFDQTESRNLAEQLRQSQKLENLGTLAGGIAHDFNNILAIMSVHASLLKTLQPTSERMSQSIDALRTAVQRGAALVSQLLTFARKRSVRFDAVQVNSVVQETSSMLNATLPKTISISLQLGKNLPTVAADGNQLHQLLLNLCVNARDAMPNGGTLTIATEQMEGARLRTRFPETRAHYVCISVGDTGTGIDAATRARIFEPFFTTKEQGKGTGLGLSVVYGIVKSHEGLIDVESELGRGTTFRVYLPLQLRGVHTESLTPAASKVVAGGTETVLVVEDEEALLTGIKDFLEQKGYRVLTARNGLEAVEVFEKARAEIAVVLTDLGLPKQNGWDAYSQMREIDANVKAVLVTGSGEAGKWENIANRFPVMVMQKPYDLLEVLAKVREMIDRPITNRTPAGSRR